MTSSLKTALLIGGLTVLGGPALRAEEPRHIWSGGFERGWQNNWAVHKRGSWGNLNLHLASEPEGKFSSFLRVTYPAGSASPTVTRSSHAPVGGTQFYASLGMRPRDSLHLRYYVRFPEGFDFVKGGKLPGLYGGNVGTGGHVPDGDNGLTTRFMWRRLGDGEVYAYLPTSIEHGTSLGRGSWRFIPGQWHLLEQAVDLNTMANKDGRIRVWIDEKPVLDEKSLLFRTTQKLKIEGILFSTFFGGHDATWATPKATHIDFAQFAVDAAYIGP
jgi:hypothetical protein